MIMRKRKERLWLYCGCQSNLHRSGASGSLLSLSGLFVYISDDDLCAHWPVPFFSALPRFSAMMSGWALMGRYHVHPPRDAAGTRRM